MDFRGHQNTGDRRGTNLFSEQDRLNTFHDWPQCAAVEPLALAKAGLYYLGQGDRVRCAFCMGTLKNWKHGDDPFVEHRTHFRNCPFVGGQNDCVGNIPLKPAESQPSPQAKRGTVPRKDDQVFEGGMVLNPRHPDYQSIDSRMASFVGWPPGVATQPSKMAEAGFYYCGQADNVCCFCCDGHLRNWEPEDDPWVEHARWFPRCAYVHQQKGSAYINDIQARKTAVLPSSTATAEALSEEQLKTSEVFKQAVDMGFGQDAVVSGLRQHMSTSGNQLPSLDHLISLLVGENSAIQPGTGEGAFLPSEPTSAMGQRLEEGGSSDRVLCKVCMDREVSVTFLLCGHLVCCAQCAQLVKQCPVCRKDVRASIRTYLC
ncbi:hypothetical protein ACOMHN_001829 [Nucella lapillus]